MRKLLKMVLLFVVLAFGFGALDVYGAVEDPKGPLHKPPRATRTDQ